MANRALRSEKLLNALYVREELADAANNLRVTAHRLKKMIIDAGLPEYDYIRHQKRVFTDGMRRFLAVVDARTISGALYEEAAELCRHRNRRKNCSTQVCNMYRGEFLPEIVR